MAEALHLYAILTSNNGIQKEISSLESQIKGLQPGTPEYEYDELVLKREQRELQIRNANPNLDPQTLAGSEALNQLLANDPAYQGIIEQINTLCYAHPSESTTWGFPLDQDPQDVTYIEIN